MAASLDLFGTARLLLDAGLARADARVVIARDLSNKLDRVADLTTLKGIARLLPERRPLIGELEERIPEEEVQ